MERAFSGTSQIAAPIQTALSSAAISSSSEPPPFENGEEEEPYTIKCICDFSDDDGNTIYCEQCDTWQHIQCFYPGRVQDASREEFDHSCHDCKPRILDRKDATERQRHQRQNKTTNESGEKKTKRPPSKSHKKKSKPSDLQVNGYHEHDGHKHGSPQDNNSHSYTKKVKGHRSNQSVSSQIKRSPPSVTYNARLQNHAHPPSPAHTPPDLPTNFQVHSYSDNFLTLYDEDHAAPLSQTNSFANLSVTNAMSLWLHDPEKLREDAGILDKEDVFQNLMVDVDTLKWPELRVEHKDAAINDTTLRWKYLITPTNLPQTGRIGELNGLVGFQKDYCNDTENRWHESAHPRPFIFFHPRLPLFIDTRQEGSKCRYVRRSCQANTNLETFIANGSEYHFWLISERPLAANEQITIPWDFRFPAHFRARFLHLLNLGDEDGAPFDGADITDEEYEQLTNIIHLVLSDYGGCACDLGNDCAFARFHRNYHGRSHVQSNGVKPKKGRKPKQQHISPTSTGHATNSRAASEGQQEQYDEDDSRSVSGSIRSKPQSRDLTPHGDVESNGVLVEISDREKRKIAMVEASFKKIEQEQPPRKKKRVSDSSTMGTSTTPQPTPKPRQRSAAPRMSVSQPSTTNGNGARARQYVDASTSRRQSGSPFSATSPTAALPSPGNPASRSGSATYRSRQPSVAPKSNYVDSSTQTDNVDNAWFGRPRESPTPKRSIIPLSMRLVKNRLRIQAQQEAQRRDSAVSVANCGDEKPLGTSPSVSMDLDVPVHDEKFNPESPTDGKGRNTSFSSSTPSIDVSSACVDANMTDAPAIIVGSSIKPLPPPWPGISNPHGSNPTPLQKSPDLRVQMPPTPNFSNPNMSGTHSGPVTPSSAAGSIAQSPFGTVHFPTAFPAPTINGAGQHASPVKTTKKLSLSDYKAARLKRTDTSGGSKPATGTSPTMTSAVLKPSLSTVEESKVSGAGILEGSALVDSPIVGKMIDPIVSTAGSTSYPASKSNMSSEKPNGTL